jgi:uncharacterized protein (TIGR00255 family)
MIKSMTGYGKAIFEASLQKVTIEIKSLNSKQLDISTKLPWLYKEKEYEIRNLISRKLVRGKIDFAMYVETSGQEVSAAINKEAVISYYNSFKEIASELNITPDSRMFSAIMKLPEALKNDKEVPEEEWLRISEKIDESLQLLDQFRIEEGNSIMTDMRGCIEKILAFLTNIGLHDEERLKRIREKLNTSLEENIGSENIDKNRFEQELIYYIEKLDINEEKVRLKTHCDYFLETLKSDSPNGRLLNFICQEIGREINTIGSKANDAEIQKLVVLMKDELEKIKEQTQNVL